ncbi:MAG: hypothetical protein Kow00108_03760 [Calditrichia bacterium]
MFKKLFFVVITLTLFFLGCGSDGDLKSFQELVNKFDNATQRAKMTSDELNVILQDIVKEYPDSVKMILTKVDTSLNPEEYELLEELILNEQDISLKSQLNRILELQKELAETREELQNLRYVLPLPIEVKKGDSHFSICLNYLMENHNLSKEEARKLIEKVGLFEPVVPGFFVWNYYKDGTFGSFVTQGNASVTPMQVYRKNKEEVQKMIETAQMKRDSALAIASELRDLKQQLENELNNAYGQLEKTQQRIDSLNAVHEKIQKRLNSLLYYVDLESTLKKQDYLSGGFLRKTDLKKMPPSGLFEHLDLRIKDGFTLKSQDYNLNKFDRVVLYPKSFKLDIDYQIIFNDDMNEAIIFLKKPYKFKGQKIIVAIK